MNRILLVLAVAALSGGGAIAQIALPGASGDAPAATDDAPAGDVPTKPKRHARHAGSVTLAADPASLDGKTLRLNGRDGELRLAKGPDGKLQIVKFSLLGEVISTPTQKCRIDIVADAPIDATPQGEPDGLPRFAANIPACPLTFDVVADGVLAPSQANACAFSAADCQASPSGLWGPAAADLEPKTVARARAAADRSIQDSLRALERRDKDAAASLTREESDFAAERDDVCHDYAGETKLGFCASRLQQTRAALLAKRLSQAGPEPKDTRKKRRK